MGGEDIDFPNGVATGVSITAATFRTGYARCRIGTTSAAGLAKSTLFPGGAVTSCWFSFQGYSTAFSGNQRHLGLGKSGTSSGLFIGSGATLSGSNAAVALWKYDGTTQTILATESGFSLTISTVHRFDVQLVSYGASATVNVYIDSILVITFTGNVAVTGVTAVDSVFINQPSFPLGCSEIIVADEDTRSWLGLLTMAANAVGTTQNWSNPAITNVNPTTINDANAAFVNTTGQDEQYNLIDEPSGTFVVKAVKIAARALCTAGATANVLKLGFNSGGSVAVAASHSPGTTMATFEDYFTTNPVTTAAWGDSTEMNALQLELKS
jgi:hypothetical protein